uniref:Uncharacterized protein n=1 Tax=Rhizochromulina marina TaxID=1034831 RepID=A0A7S2W736_9STRA
MFELLGGDLRNALNRELEIMKEAATTGTLDALVEVHEDEQWEQHKPPPGEGGAPSSSARDAPSPGAAEVAAVATPPREKTVTVECLHEGSMAASSEDRSLRGLPSKASPGLSAAAAAAAATPPPTAPLPPLSAYSSASETEAASGSESLEGFSFPRGEVLAQASSEARAATDRLFEAPAAGTPQRDPAPPSSLDAQVNAILSDRRPQPSPLLAHHQPVGAPILRPPVKGASTPPPATAHPHLAAAPSPSPWTPAGLDPRDPNFLHQFRGGADLTSAYGFTPPPTLHGRQPSSNGDATPLSTSSLAFWGLPGSPAPSSAPIQETPPPPVGGRMSSLEYSASDAFDPILASIKGSSAAPGTVASPQWPSWLPESSGGQTGEEGASASVSTQQQLEKWGRHAFSTIREAVSGIGRVEPPYYPPAAAQPHSEPPRHGGAAPPRRVNATRDDPFARLAAEEGLAPMGLACLPISSEFWERWRYTMYVGLPGVLLLAVYFRFAYTEESV